MRFIAAIGCAAFACCVDGKPPEVLDYVTIDGADALLLGSTSSFTGMQSHCVNQSCERSASEVVSIDLVPPDLFEISVEGPTVTYKGVREGTATAHILWDDGANGFAMELPLTTALPTAMTLDVRCSRFVYRTGSDITIGYTLYAPGGKTELRHDDGVVILQSDILINDGGYFGSRRFKAPSAPGTGTITSPVYAALNAPVTIYDSNSLEDVEIVPYPFFLGQTVKAESYEIVAGGQRGCSYVFKRTITTTTPTVCKVLATDTSTPVTELALETSGTFYVRGLQKGPCTLTVSADGTTVSKTQTFEVL